jgi:methenyltetrahydrofolate cyclohydrolase
MPGPSLLDLTVRELLDAVAARTSAPGGGAAAALTAALAAALTGMAARFAAPEPLPPDITARADELRARAAGLADADAAAYGAFLAALRLPRDDAGRGAAVEAARDGAAGVPGEVAAVAAAVGALASELVRHGNPNLRGDAASATLMAAAAAASAAELVAENLEPGDPRIAQARDHAEALAEVVRSSHGLQLLRAPQKVCEDTPAGRDR